MVVTSEFWISLPYQEQKNTVKVTPSDSKIQWVNCLCFKLDFIIRPFSIFAATLFYYFFFITNRATFRDFRSIFIESRTAGILASVLTGLNELLTSRCPKSTIKTFKESERWGTRITGALMETLMDTRGDFSANWAMATFALSVTASDASRTFPLAASIWLCSSSTWKPFRYSCLETYDLERNLFMLQTLKIRCRT